MPTTEYRGRPKRARVPHNLDTVAAKFRNGFELLSPLNEKTPKGEALGYLTSILYLAPAEEAGGKTVCPYSTPACRAGCLYTAGRGMFERVKNARIRRTRMYLEQRDAFFDGLVGELVQMQDTADRHGLTLAIRLNGTSDIAWEREVLDGRTIFEMFPRARFYDYTKIPLHHRHVPDNWRLTFSVAEEPLDTAVSYLRDGRNIAVVVPEEHKAHFLSGNFEHAARPWTMPPLHFVDGDEHDLRILDPSPAIVLLKPKGALRRGGPMVRDRLAVDLMRAARDGR